MQPEQYSRSGSKGFTVRTLWISLVIVGSATLSASGCVHARNQFLHSTWAPQSDRVVFAADGAGNFQVSSRMLRQTAAEDGLPVDIATYEWSHGYLRVIADQSDVLWARGEGEKLADLVMEFHRQYPQVKIYLWGHSAGAAVVLSAQEALPP